MIGTESFGIAQVGDEQFRFIGVRDFGEKRPKTRYRFFAQTVSVFVEIVVKVRRIVPHKRIDPRFDRKVHAPVLETQIFIVEDIAECRHV